MAIIKVFGVIQIFLYPPQSKACFILEFIPTCLIRIQLNLEHLQVFNVCIVPKIGILDPSRFSAQIRKVEARLRKLAKIRKVETN